MRARSSLLLLCSVVVGSGCNGFSPVRLVEMETTRGNNTTVKEVTYGDDGRIEEIETRSNGNFLSRLEFIWEGGTLSELVYERANEDDLDISLEYKDGRLVGMEAKRGNTEYTIDIKYEDNDPSFLREHTFVIQSGSTRTTRRRSVKYDEGRAVEGREEVTIATGLGSLSETYELKMRRDKNGLPQRLKMSGTVLGITSRRTAEYSFGDDRRLEEVEYDDGERIELDYDNEGRIEEMEITTRSGQRTVHEMRYENGNQSGFAFVAPDLPANVLFDLTGRALDRPDVFTDAWFPMP